MWLAEDEVAEAEVLHHRAPQVHVHLLRVLVYEGGPVFGGVCGVFRFAGLDDDRYERVLLADGGTELDAAQPVLRPAFRLGKTHVGDDSQQVVLVFFIDAVCLVVGTCQDYLGTSSHAQGALVGIQGLGTEFLALLEDKLVEIGQDGGVETHLVLHQQDDLHAHLVDIVLQVHLVLDQLDDGHQQVGVAQPAKDVFKGTEVLIGHTFAHPVAEGGEDDDGDMRIVLLDAPGGVEDFRLSRAGHADDQIIRKRGQLTQRFVASSGLGEAGRGAEGEGSVFIEYLLVDAPVVFQHEGVVRIGHQQYIEDAALHQVGKLGILEVELVEFEFA